MLTDFDLSYCQGSTTPSLLMLPAEQAAPAAAAGRTSSGINCAGSKGERGGEAAAALPSGQQALLVAQPDGRANSFVGTEEYLAPEVITGAHCCCSCTAAAHVCANYGGLLWPSVHGSLLSQLCPCAASPSSSNPLHCAPTASTPLQAPATHPWWTGGPLASSSTSCCTAPRPSGTHLLFTKPADVALLQCCDACLGSTCRTAWTSNSAARHLLAAQHAQAATASCANPPAPLPLRVLPSSAGARGETPRLRMC